MKENLSNTEKEIISNLLDEIAEEIKKLIDENISLENALNSCFGKIRLTSNYRKAIGQNIFTDASFSEHIENIFLHELSESKKEEKAEKKQHLTQISEYFNEKAKPYDFRMIHKDVARLKQNKTDFINWKNSVFKETLIQCKNEFKPFCSVSSLYNDEVMIKSCLNEEQSDGVDCVLRLTLDYQKPSILIYSKCDDIEFDTAIIYTGIFEGLHTPYPVNFRKVTQTEITAYILRTYIEYTHEYKKSNIENKFFKYLRLLSPPK